MPNYVKVRVIAQDTEALKKYMVDEEGRVNFNILIPKPKELDITAGSDSYQDFSQERPVNFQLFHDIQFGMLPKYNKDITQKEFIQACLNDETLVDNVVELKHSILNRKDEALRTYFAGFFNVQRFGFTDWYEWSIKNWGTKWNAIDSIVSDDCIEFETAWNAPWGVLEALAKITPIRVIYADEDMGYNCGLYQLEADDEGEVIETQLLGESAALAYDTWGYGQVTVYDDETGDEIEDEKDPRFIEANKDYFEIQEQINRLMSIENFRNDLVAEV